MRYLQALSRLLLITSLSALGTLAFAAPMITVVSPKSGATVGAPTYFEATASTSSCGSGISAVRIYTAPGVNALTTNSPHLETFLNLKPGSYNTVVQAFDNCGGVSKVAVNITVASNAGVHVFLPAAGANTTPVHFAVSAQNPACAAGISAVRIYTAPGLNAFTNNGATLDAFINLLPGTYNTVAQAWDNCGHVFKTPVTINSTGGPSGKFFYTANQNLNNVYEYKLSAGVISNPNGSNTPPHFAVPAGPNSIVSDPSGNFVYVGLSDGRTSVLDINRANGSLFIKGNVSASGAGPAAVAVHPSGDFLFVAEQGSNKVTSYRINRSDGSLSTAGSFSTGAAPVALNTDFSGRFLYVSNFNSHDISAYAINTSTGALTAVAGSPFMSGTQPITLSGTSKDMYISANDLMYAYSISSSGALTQVSGSPFVEPEMGNELNSFMVDPLHSLLIYTGVGFTAGTDDMWSVAIQSNGTLANGNPGGSVNSPSLMILDPSYRYVYIEEFINFLGVASLSYSSTGTFTNLSGPLDLHGATPAQLAVAP